MLGSNGTGKDTPESPRIVAEKHSCETQCPDFAAKQTGSVAQEAAKACCLDRLSSDRG